MNERTDYKTMQAKLDEVIELMKSPDTSIDDAVELYERGLKLIERIEEHLNSAQNKIKFSTKLKKKSG